ncbi:MAG: type II secretion system protein J [Trueperaceae bacterium]
MRGITLVELLVALFVFSIVAALAASGIVQALRVQSLNEANTSLQGKLRRITEVVSQDLRSAVLGAIVDAPYASGDDQVSFTLAVGGQGFEVREISGAGAFAAANTMSVFSNGAPVTTGQRILLVNGDGIGSTVPAGTVADRGNGRFDVVLGGGCTNQIDFVDPMRLFVVDAIGYSLLANGDLARQVSGAAAQSLAFGLSAFEVQYAYRANDGTLTVLDAPRTAAGGGPPLRLTPTEVLESLRVRVAAEEPIFGNRTAERSYLANIALPASGSVNLRSVVSCP